MEELWHLVVFNLAQAKWITVTSNFCMISKNSLLLSLKLVGKYLRLQYICHLFSPCSLLVAGRQIFEGNGAFLFIVGGRTQSVLIIIFHSELKEALEISTQIECRICMRQDADFRHRKRIICVGGDLWICVSWGQVAQGIVQSSFDSLQAWRLCTHSSV